MSACGVSLDISGLHLLDDAEAARLLDLARLALAQLCSRLRVAGEIRVRVVRDDDMADIHERTMGVPGTTDVVTFDLREESEKDAGAPLDTDLVICIDEARRQATLRNIPVEHELLLYIVHGALHCCPGYDDHGEEAAKAMHAMEDAVLMAVGVGPVYSASPRQAP